MGGIAAVVFGGILLLIFVYCYVLGRKKTKNTEHSFETKSKQIHNVKVKKQKKKKSAVQMAESDVLSESTVISRSSHRENENISNVKPMDNDEDESEWNAAENR